MKKFLQLVAETFLREDAANLGQYCFVFPNKRSGAFFLHYLRAMASRPTVTPEIKTMGELLADISPLAEASRDDQIFMLYNQYRELSRDIPDFDRFRFWGEMLLNDFDDADRYLVDVHMLFGNVKNYRQINSDYLTSEQKEIIRRYWPETFADEAFSGDGRFWKHLDSEKGTGPKFMKLWEVLWPLYSGFRSTLRSHGLSTKGMFYRDAVELLQKDGTAPITDDYERVVFVGFNVLSTSELKIMERLKAAGCADFYWKANSPALNIPDNRAADFVKRCRTAFPGIHDIGDEPSCDFPDIDIIGVPSKVGQAEVAGEILEKWRENHVIGAGDTALNTAVVLPDESLLVPLLDALPGDIVTNITMGIPMRQTPVAALVSDIVSMRLRLRAAHGETEFFHTDVRSVLTHPVIVAIAPGECNALLAEMTQKRMFMVPQSRILQLCPSLEAIFAQVNDADDFDCVYEYIVGLMQFLLVNTTSNLLIQRFVRGYLDAAGNLRDAVRRYGIDMRSATVFRMIERNINSAIIRFKGRPLKGLQVMGLLETRVLDFDNIIVMSMNERIFPKKYYTRSFIPENLRKAYGMPTSEFDESVYGYYFYSMISRAKRLTLLYDARKGTHRVGEMSRYLAQLLYLSGASNITHRMAMFSTPTFDKPLISMPKTPAVMEKLKRFTLRRDDDGERAFLSASAINKYINCQLDFYLSYVEGLAEDDEITDFIDAGTYGSVVHRVVENLYRGMLPGRAASATVTADVLDRIINDRRQIERLVTEAINACHNKMGDGCFMTLEGENAILGELICRIIVKMLECEKQIAPFEFIAAENKVVTRWRVNDSLEVNFKMVIDRIDRLSNGLLRFVDYKTGTDETAFNDMQALFDSENTTRRKAILQLLLYCELYSREKGLSEPIQPVIYQLKTLFTKGLGPIKYNNAPLTDFHDCLPEFMPEMEAVVASIFDPTVQFTATTSEHNCTFCSFKGLCNREALKF